MMFVSFNTSTRGVLGESGTASASAEPEFTPSAQRDQSCSIFSFLCSARERPFNLRGGGGLRFFVSFRNFFSDNTRVRIFFYQNLILGYMTKTLNQIFFFLHQNWYIFSATLGIRIFFQKKKHSQILYQALVIYLTTSYNLEKSQKSSREEF